MPTTAAVNSGSAHEIDAMAYEMPNTNIDPPPVVRPPRCIFGSATTGSNPRSMATPSTAKPIPITMVAQGTHS